MAVRFSKLKTINLNDEDQEETELTVEEDGLEGTDQGEWEVNVNHDDGGEMDDEGKTKLIIEDDDIAEVKRGSPPRWMFWRSRGSYSPLKQRRIKKCPCYSWKVIAIAVLTFTVVFLISLIISALVPEPSEGGVSTDSPVCSDMSAEILRRGGSAVDASITALLCVGVVHAESSGIGGGGFMIVRETNGSVHAINFREAAPGAATVDMYHSDPQLSKTGGLAVGVPGEIKGMEKAHKLFGKLPWKDLFEPVIKLCKEGFSMSTHTEKSVESSWAKMPLNFQQIFLNGDGTRKKAGDLIRRTKLGETLQKIANNGSREFYSGAIARSIVDAVTQNQGIMTMDDLSSYEARLERPVQVDFNGYTVYSTPAPSGGPLLLFILNVMDEYHLTPSSSINLTYHRLIEAFKYGFALRTLLGDPSCDQCDKFKKTILDDQQKMTSESYAAIVRRNISDDSTHNVSQYHAHFYSVTDSGTTHISVLSPDGQAVSVTSTVNTYFGSKVFTDTGIVLNNEMDDFSSPNITNYFGLRPSEVNFIYPGKRPLSSTCPVIITQHGSKDVPVRLIMGASGGTTIPTSVAQAALRVMSLGESVSDAIKAKRAHHQLFPNVVTLEADFPKDVIEFLSARGHQFSNTTIKVGVVQGITVNDDGSVEAYADPRKNDEEGHAVVVSRT